MSWKLCTDVNLNTYRYSISLNSGLWLTFTEWFLTFTHVYDVYLDAADFSQSWRNQKLNVWYSLQIPVCRHLGQLIWANQIAPFTILTLVAQKVYIRYEILCGLWVEPQECSVMSQHDITTEASFNTQHKHSIQICLRKKVYLSTFLFW